jgi:hypothetical protein
MNLGNFLRAKVLCEQVKEIGPLSSEKHGSRPEQLNLSVVAQSRLLTPIMGVVSKIFSAPSLTQADPCCLCAMLDDSQLVKYFPTLLKALKARIKALPVSLPIATPEAPLARYLGDLEIDAEEGARYTANRQWECTFQVSEDEQRKWIILGKYGMDLVCPFLEFYSRQVGIKDTEGVGMLARRIRALNTILDSM